MEWCRSLSDAERNEKLAPAGLGMDTEGGITFGVQDGIEGGAEVEIALEVSEDADELDEVALCGISIVDGCHDDRELDFAALHEEMDEEAKDLLIQGRYLGSLQRDPW